MDGRVRNWVLAAVAATALPSAGCRLFDQKDPEMPSATLPVAGQAKGGFFSSSPKYGPVPEQIPVREARRKGEPWKPETFVAVGDAELEAAFDDARTGADRDQMIDVARQRYEAALKQNPKNKDALLGMAKLYTWAGDRERAMQKLQEAATNHPKDKDVAFAKVRTCITLQDWDGACKASEVALALDPENRTYTKSLGYALARANRWDDAFGTLMRVMPESEARTFLGRTLTDLGRPDDGQKQFQAAVRIDPNNEVARGMLQGAQDPSPTQLQQAGYTR